MKPFSLQIDEWVKKTKANADEAVGGIVVHLASAIDELSPVGNPDKWSDEFKRVGRELGWYGDGYVGGRFRANWQLGIDQMPGGTIDAVDPDGRQTQARIAAAIPEHAAGPVYFIANNLPYAQRLEYGYSKQAPKGMVGLTVTRFQDIVKEEVERLP